MNDKNQEQERVEALLACDTTVSSFQFEEFHMRLETSIKCLEQRARTINRGSICGFGVFFVCVLSTPLLAHSGIFDQYEWVRFMWSGCGVSALILTGILSGIYTYKYRPALDRAKNDLQSGMFIQLQQQVAELSRKLEG